MTEESSEIRILITSDEALVLFEFLRRYSDTDQLNVVDQAEQRALWNLCCIFEKTPVAPFDMEYGQALADARERLRDEE
ncbi:hypothetical protein [Massilia sp. S19_KUP03_FR1]|uniref:hypothetical protein n=1 Tax=Massilia sp. S19_KUP03_FR1 TaxID=3025503 RepID=UPI002FCD5C7D